MKSKTLVTSFSLLLFAGVYGCFTVPADEYNNSTQNYATQSVSDEYNANDLNIYGEWIVVPEYGRVWRPYANNDWQPFAEGHWVYDGNDWVWDSYEPYGAIVYHYGNWEYISNHRWIWIPSHTRWSPACVDWMYYGDQVAWAPRPLHGHSFGNPWDRREYQAWVVIRNENFYDDHVYKYRVADATRDNGRYRDDQITRKAPPVTYVREHTRNPIPVTSGINRNGTISPGRSNERNPQPTIGTPATPVTTPPATTVRTPASTPTVSEPVKPVPAPTTGGVTTTPGSRNPGVGTKAPEPTPVKPQTVATPGKTTRNPKHGTRQNAGTIGRQQQTGKSTGKDKKDTPAKTQTQPTERTPSGNQEKQERKPQPR